MDLFAIIFAVLMMAAALAATILVGMVAGGACGALAFAALLVATYRAFTREIGPARPARSDELNAFQRPMTGG